MAHPPCQLWVNLAHVNYKRYGGAKPTLSKKDASRTPLEFAQWLVDLARAAPSESDAVK